MINKYALFVNFEVIMSCSFDFHLVDENATVAMGNKLAAIIEQGAVIYLHGDGIKVSGSSALIRHSIAWPRITTSS